MQVSYTQEKYEKHPLGQEAKKQMLAYTVSV